MTEPIKPNPAAEKNVELLKLMSLNDLRVQVEIAKTDQINEHLRALADAVEHKRKLMMGEETDPTIEIQSHVNLEDYDEVLRLQTEIEGIKTPAAKPPATPPATPLPPTTPPAAPTEEATKEEKLPKFSISDRKTWHLVARFEKFVTSVGDYFGALPSNTKWIFGLALTGILGGIAVMPGLAWTKKLIREPEAPPSGGMSPDTVAQAATGRIALKKYERKDAKVMTSINSMAKQMADKLPGDKYAAALIDFAVNEKKISNVTYAQLAQYAADMNNTVRNGNTNWLKSVTITSPAPAAPTGYPPYPPYGYSYPPPPPAAPAETKK